MRISDWSSDVCSSDLQFAGGVAGNVLDAQAGVEVALAGREQHAVGHHAGAIAFQAHVEFVARERGTEFEVQAAVLGVLGEYGIGAQRSEEHTSELQSLMRISYAVFCLKKKNQD